MNKHDLISLVGLDRRIISSVSGTAFWEGGFNTGECEGEPSIPPRWFCDIRSADRLRVNCLTSSTIYLVSDGSLFHLTPLPPLMPAPLEDAIRNDAERLRFIMGVFERDKMRFPGRGKDVWGFYSDKEVYMYEVGEYVPDESCDEKSNLWKVAAGARRTGRFIYTAKRKTAKGYLEGPSNGVPWVFASSFDQFTTDYEKRYNDRVTRRAEERCQSRQRSSRNARTFDFGFDVSSEEISNSIRRINHYEVLGISSSSGPREIKAAYWELARRFHPDLNPGDPAAEERFKCLSVSYQELIRKYQ